MNDVVLDFSRPGKPTNNSFVESFNGKVRAECIDQNWFLSLSDARVKCEAFRHDYNYVRPHSSIEHKTPMEFVKSLEASCHHKVLKGKFSPKVVLALGQNPGKSSSRVVQKRGAAHKPTDTQNK